ncbi:hypothetical protein ACNA6I_13415 [Rossellomorea sp. FS2]|uniref:hypothetical protein n=1 Tax=Rossellomorea sp. FS2 TaxID=3391447 RepID=UPI003A4E4F39
MDELANSGVKYIPNDVVAVTKNADGKIVWLENGYSQAGFNHILNHADEFATKGNIQSQLPEFITMAVNEGKTLDIKERALEDLFMKSTLMDKRKGLQ